jgi:hypothetical protein
VLLLPWFQLLRLLPFMAPLLLCIAPCPLLLVALLLALLRLLARGVVLLGLAFLFLLLPEVPVPPPALPLILI